MRLFVLGHGPIIDWPSDVQMMTPFRLPSRSPGLDGVGEGWIAQVLPFQCSASVRPFSDFFTEAPAAVQLAEEVHDTPFRPSAIEPDGRAVG